MKRSQFILRASAFILAIAGVFAVKANQKFIVSYYYYTTDGGSCLLLNNPIACTNAGTTSCTTANGDGEFVTR